ncbi:SSI family serine proteinase inhibitor [Actinoallomurus sp. NPDC052308]|uniref:SSI family serine proteinase inhibitor n=1 Tax=Actinoallomurus sp. NPDC052308 TaxID=3155530 RepID=UPI003438CE49
MRMPDSLRGGGRRTITVAALGLLALVTGPAAVAAPMTIQIGPVGVYTLSVRTIEGGDPARTTVLTCDPDGGTHLAPAAACDQLRAVDGRIADLPEASGACTLVYAPVRVTAAGRWNGGSRRYTRTFFNRCAAIRATGGVIFAF